MNDFRSRLLLLIETMGLNANKLSKEVGGTTAKYYKLLNGETEPNFSTVQAILETYPRVSAEWLTRGKGDIFTSGTDADTESVLDLKQKIDILERELEREKAIVNKFVGKPETTTEESLLVDEESEAFGTFTEENFPEGIIPFEGMILIAKYRDANFIFPNCSHN